MVITSRLGRHDNRRIQVFFWRGGRKQPPGRPLLGTAWARARKLSSVTVSWLVWRRACSSPRGAPRNAQCLRRWASGGWLAPQRYNPTHESLWTGIGTRWHRLPVIWRTSKLTCAVRCLRFVCGLVQDVGTPCQPLTVHRMPGLRAGLLVLPVRRVPVPCSPRREQSTGPIVSSCGDGRHYQGPQSHGVLQSDRRDVRMAGGLPSLRDEARREASGAFLASRPGPESAPQAARGFSDSLVVGTY